MPTPPYSTSIDAANLDKEGSFLCPKCGTTVPFQFHGLNRVGVAYADSVSVFCPHCSVELSVHRHLDTQVLIEAFDDPVDRIERLIELQKMRQKL